MSSAEAGTPPLQAFLDAFNAHDVDAIMAFFTDDCVLDMPRGPAPGGRRLVGKQEVRKGVQARFDGIPDVVYGDERHFTSGDRGVSEWTIRGTQATGEPIEVRGCDLFEFTDGKISRKDSSGRSSTEAGVPPMFLLRDPDGNSFLIDQGPTPAPADPAR